MIVDTHWSGNEYHKDCSSVNASFAVSKLLSIISCNVFPEKTELGDSLIVWGEISPSVSGKIVILILKRPSGAVSAVTASTNEAEEYYYTYSPNEIGLWYATATWGGDHNYGNCSSPIKTFEINKHYSSLSCNISSSELKSNDSIYVWGILTPNLSSKRINLIFTKLSGSIIAFTTFTDADGCYFYSYVPNEPGTWNVKAMWLGDSTHKEATTPTQYFIVSGAKKAFSVSSNSTVSALVFDLITNTLSFNVSGPQGTKGYTQVTVTKSLIKDASALKISLDGTEIDYSLESLNDVWIIGFSYSHSVHRIILSDGQKR